MKESKNRQKLNPFAVFLGIIKLTPRIPKILHYIKKIKSIDTDDRMSIGKIIEANAVEYKDIIALRFEEQSYTYEQFNHRVNQYANYLLQEGVKNGDTVIAFLENRPELLFLIAAAAKIGVVLSLINPNQRGKVLIHSMELDTSRFFFIGEELVEPFEEVKSSLSTKPTTRYYWVSDLGHTKCPEGYTSVKTVLESIAATNPATTNQIKAGQQYANVFTSGTTGLPKASRQTHQKWVKTFYWFGKINLNLNSSDVMYVPLPFYHTNALIVAWPTTMAAGCTMVMRRKFSVSNFWDDVHMYNVSAFIYIGEICRYLLNGAPSDLEKNHRIRKIMGNGMQSDTWRSFKERFKIPIIFEFYGAADGNVGFTNTLNLDNTIGWSPQNFKIIKYDVENESPIKNKDGFLVPVKMGESGLLISEISKKATFDGYVNKEQNRSKILQNVFKTGDSWFNSGDLLQNIGYKHARFVDRVGDTFRWKGENVSTGEVEILANILNFIDVCTVYGVQIPNNDGRAGMITIILDKTVKFDIAELAEHFFNSLPKYAVPIFVRLTSNIDTTHTHKIKKFELKKEGFQCSDDIYVMLPKTSTYIKMDGNLLKEIKEGQYIF